MKRVPKPVPTLSVEERLALEQHTYLTAPEAAGFLKLPTMQALYDWLRNNQVPRLRRGRALLFKRTDLEIAIGARQRVGARRT